MTIYYGIVDIKTQRQILRDTRTGQLLIFESREYANESVTDNEMMVIELGMWAL